MIAVVAGWGIAGLVLLGRTDALGAITGALLIYVLLRGSKATLYAGVFVMVAFLEIYGTSIGAWHWAATAPDTPLPVGNPPSGIASVYVLFDIAAIALAPRVLAALERPGAPLAYSLIPRRRQRCRVHRDHPARSAAFTAFVDRAARPRRFRSASRRSLPPSTVARGAAAGSPDALELDRRAAAGAQRGHSAAR